MATATWKATAMKRARRQFGQLDDDKLSAVCARARVLATALDGLGANAVHNAIGLDEVEPVASLAYDVVALLEALKART